MKKLRQTMAGICALSVVCSFASCGGGDDGSVTGTTTAPASTTAATASGTAAETLASEDVEALGSAESLLRDVKNEKKTIKFLSNWDINPGAGESVPAALSIFRTKYEGEIEWVETTWENRYNDLSTQVLGGTGIDFFAIEEDCLPKGVISGMFQPVDDYIDMNSVLWQGVNSAMDVYNFGGKHYALVTGVSANNIVYYNKQTIEDNGLEDPWELFEAGEWNWDTFSGMLQDFIDADEDHVGLDGWWSELALYRSGGVPYIQSVDGELVVNTNSPEIEKAQNFMLSLYNKGLVMDKSLFEWNAQEQFMGEGRELFMICGTWYVMNPPEIWASKIPPEHLGIVPIPNAADAEHPAMDAKADGFCLVKGAQNPEGVALYAECCLATAKDEAARAIYDKQCREDYKWPEDVIEHRYIINDLATQYPVIDIAGGISADVESLTTSNANKSVGLNASLHGVDWGQTREEIGATVELLVSEVNDQLKAAN